MNLNPVLFKPETEYFSYSFPCKKTILQKKINCKIFFYRGNRFAFPSNFFIRLCEISNKKI